MASYSEAKQTKRKGKTALCQSSEIISIKAQYWIPTDRLNRGEKQCKNQEQSNLRGFKIKQIWQLLRNLYPKLMAHMQIKIKSKTGQIKQSLEILCSKINRMLKLGYQKTVETQQKSVLKEKPQESMWTYHLR